MSSSKPVLRHIADLARERARELVPEVHEPDTLQNLMKIVDREGRFRAEELTSEDWLALSHVWAWAGLPEPRFSGRETRDQWHEVYLPAFNRSPLAQAWHLEARFLSLRAEASARRGAVERVLFATLENGPSLTLAGTVVQHPAEGGYLTEEVAAERLTQALRSAVDSTRLPTETPRKESPAERQRRRLARLRELGGDMRRAGHGWQRVPDSRKGALADLVREEQLHGRSMSGPKEVRQDIIEALERGSEGVSRA